MYNINENAILYILNQTSFNLQFQSVNKKTLKNLYYIVFNY